MSKSITKQEILTAIDEAFRELESQKYALDQSAIVAITDVKGDIIYVNDQFCRISQYAESELLGQNHRIINSGHHSLEFFREMWRTIANGGVWRNDIKNRAKDGSFYWVATTITPYLNEHGKPHTYVSIRFDITKQKELELQLEEKLRERTQMLSRLSEQNKQLEDFCHIISHNLRAPLSNLLMLGQLIDACETLDERLEYISKLGPVVNFLHETFEQLVNATQTRMDYGVDRDRVDLQEALDRAAGLLQGDILQSKASISKAFDVTHVQYPRKYLDSILFNLLSNSLKYRSPEKTPKIHVGSYRNGDGVYLEIKDNGLGIDLDRHGDKIFKLRKTFHEHPDAKGFGLFITKTQIDAMGGEIEVHSVPNEGTVFKLKLYDNSH